MAFDIIDWQDGMIMDRDLKILDQARTIERLSKEIVILHTSHNPQGRVETIDCDPHTCEHVKEIVILRGSAKTNCTEPTQDPNLAVLHTCDPDTCKHAIENKDKSKRLAYYENAHSPSSKNNLPTKHVGFKHLCNNCEHEWDTRNQIPYTPGTEFGNNLLTFACQCLSCLMTQGMIRGFFDFFGLSVSKSTINNAIVALANRIQKRFVEELLKNAIKSRFVKFDETPFKVIYKLGYVWICVTDTAVLVVVADTRGTIVLDQHFKILKDKPKTVDGYAAYPTTKDTQRCWDHFKRDSENVVLSSQYPTAAQKLYNELMKLYHIAKGRPPGDVSDLIARTLDIADKHEKYGHKFATKLRKAAPNLYTFVNHPGMDPTNCSNYNVVERYMQPVAILRHLSLHFMSKPGMVVWSTIWTFVFTCRKQGKSIKEECLKILSPEFQ